MAFGAGVGATSPIGIVEDGALVVFFSPIVVFGSVVVGAGVDAPGAV